MLPQLPLTPTCCLYNPRCEDKPCQQMKISPIVGQYVCWKRSWRKLCNSKFEKESMAGLYLKTPCFLGRLLWFCGTAHASISWGCGIKSCQGAVLFALSIFSMCLWGAHYWFYSTNSSLTCSCCYLSYFKFWCSRDLTRCHSCQGWHNTILSSSSPKWVKQNLERIKTPLRRLFS